MKEKTIFRDTVDRFQFSQDRIVPVPKFDDLPIKKVKTEYLVTEITADGTQRHVFSTSKFNRWMERNKNSLDERIRLKLVTIEKVNVFEADL